MGFTGTLPNVIDAKTAAISCRGGLWWIVLRHYILFDEWSIKMLTTNLANIMAGQVSIGCGCFKNESWMQQGVLTTGSCPVKNPEWQGTNKPQVSPLAIWRHEIAQG